MKTDESEDGQVFLVLASREKNGLIMCYPLKSPNIYIYTLGNGRPLIHVLSISIGEPLTETHLEMRETSCGMTSHR